MAGATRLLLVDATNLVHQAYHAWPPRKSRDGQPVNAVEGFVHLLLRLLDEHRPHALALAFDPGGPTFRHELWPDYKAQRDPPDADLTAQWPWLEQLAAAFRWPLVRAPGYEADDVLATLTALASAAGWTVELASADRDLCQLVTETVTLHAARGRGEVDVYDPEAVRARFGVPPVLLPDWKALVGDRSDNYPGVTGIGEKTATELLQTYGSLDGVLEAGKLLPGKRGQRLRLEADAARLAQRLATLCRTVPLAVTLPELRRQEPDQAAVASLLEQLDLQALRRRLHPRLLTAPKSLSYQMVTDSRQAAAVAQEIVAAKVVGLAWVDDGGLGLATDLGRAWVCPEPWLPQVLAPLREGQAGAVAADYGALAAGLGASEAALTRVVGEPRLAGWLLEPRGPSQPSPWSPARLLGELPPSRPPAGWGPADAWQAAWQADRARRLEPRLREGLDEAGLTTRYLQTELPLSRLWAALSEVEVPLDDAAGQVDAAWWRAWLTTGGRRVRLRPCLDDSGRLLRREPDLAQRTAGRAATLAWRARVAAPEGARLVVARWPDEPAAMIAELSGERAPLPADRDLLADLALAAEAAGQGAAPESVAPWLEAAPVVARWLADLLAGLARRGRVRTAGGRPLRLAAYHAAPPAARGELAAEALRWVVRGSLLERRQAACLAAAAATAGCGTLLPPLGGGLWWLVAAERETDLWARLAAAGLGRGWSGPRWSLLASRAPDEPGG